MPDGKKPRNVLPVLNSILPYHPDTIPFDDSGRYKSQVLPKFDYTLTVFRKANDYFNEVKTFDMVLIGRHILEVQPLASRWLWIAAAVNKDKRISVQDMLEIMKLILGAINEWAALN